MRKLLAAALLVAAIGVPGTALATPPEGCVASNPGTTTCSFTVTHFDPNGGFIAAGTGCWFLEINGLPVARGCGTAAAMVAPCLPGDVWTGHALSPVIVFAIGCPT